MSSSRLFDKRSNSNPDGMVSSVNRRSLREYVPKMLAGGSDPTNSPYNLYSGHKGSLPNGMNQRASDNRNLPRTDMNNVNVNYSADPYPRFKQSYRSRSFEPDLRPDPVTRPDVNFSTVDNRRGKRYNKHSGKNNDSSRKRDKNAKSKSQRVNGSGAHIDKIHRSYSAGRVNHRQNAPTYPSDYPDGRILSSNLQTGTYMMSPTDSSRNNIMNNGQRRSQSPSLENGRNVCYAVKYRPVNANGNIYMYQTKL